MKKNNFYTSNILSTQISSSIP